ARHPALRVRYASTSDGRPMRSVGPAEGAWALVVHDLESVPVAERLGEAAARIAELAERRIDLERGPFVEVALFRIDAVTHRLIVRTHHIQTDGFSLRLLLAEVEALVAAPELESLGEALAPWSAPVDSAQQEARLAAWTARLEARPLPPPLF